MHGRGRCRRSRAGRGAADGAAGAPVRGSRPATTDRARARLARGGRDPASSASGVTSHTPARFFLPASVSTSSAPPSNRRRNIGALGFFALAARNRSRPALIRWTRRTRSPPSTGNRRFLPRRSAPSSRLPSRAESGGSNVFSVAMCAGPGLFDRCRRDERVELPYPGLHLRQLRHRQSRWLVPAARAARTDPAPNRSASRGCDGAATAQPG